MGLLDEAIREHLELKRRRGADPSEIARLEHEALGPVRREPFRPADSEPGLEELRERAAASEHGDLHDAEYRDYYEEEYYVEENGDDWGDAFADQDLEPRHGSGRRGEASAEPDLEPAAESPLERQAEPGSRRWRGDRRADATDGEIRPAPPSEPEGSEDLGDGEETVEYNVEDALTEDRRSRKGKGHPQSPPDDEGDVLEETPEFLQDAPEHDRLWFEQRPPRDFDFDD